jgi:hypothetical protein
VPVERLFRDVSRCFLNKMVIIITDCPIICSVNMNSDTSAPEMGAVVEGRWSDGSDVRSDEESCRGVGRHADGSVGTDGRRRQRCHSHNRGGLGSESLEMSSSIGVRLQSGASAVRPSEVRAEERSARRSRSRAGATSAHGFHARVDSLWRTREITDVGNLQDIVAHAVRQMKEELQDEQLLVHSVLGKGGFGTVYHGTF